jgi:hypothetical protein
MVPQPPSDITPFCVGGEQMYGLLDSRRACRRIFTLSSPSRLVMDVPNWMRDGPARFASPGPCSRGDNPGLVVPSSGSPCWPMPFLRPRLPVSSDPKEPPIF